MSGETGDADTKSEEIIERCDNNVIVTEIILTRVSGVIVDTSLNSAMSLLSICTFKLIISTLHPTATAIFKQFIQT